MPSAPMCLASCRIGLIRRIWPLTCSAGRATAQAIAGRAATAPAGLVRRTKATVQALAAIDAGDQAVALEVGPQFASMGEPAFTELLARLKAQISTQP